MSLYPVPKEDLVYTGKATGCPQPSPSPSLFGMVGNHSYLVRRPHPNLLSIRPFSRRLRDNQACWSKAPPYAYLPGSQGARYFSLTHLIAPANVSWTTVHPATMGHLLGRHAARPTLLPVLPGYRSRVSSLSDSLTQTRPRLMAIF